MNGVQKFFGHLGTIIKHRHKVIVHCAKCGITKQGLVHDLSKFSPTEFIPSVKYYVGHRSPNVGEREAYGYSKAWIHHKGRNKHHYEYWKDYVKKGEGESAVEMPYRYVVEMMCDRIAACKVYHGKDYTKKDALHYFHMGRAQYYMHPNTKRDLTELLEMLAENGEQATFKYAKEELKRRKGLKKNER